MSSKKSNNIQKVKAKGFSFHKCFHLGGITKSFFQCKTNQNVNNADYMYMPYQSKTDTTTSSVHVSFNNPATSTMIETANRYHTPNKNSHFDEISFERQLIQQECDFMQQLHNSDSSNEDMQTEITRNRRTSIASLSSAQTCLNRSDYEEMTIVKHNTSPMSDYYKVYNQQDLTYCSSNIGMYDCLQSTKLNSNDIYSSDAYLLRTSSESPLLRSPVSSLNIQNRSPYQDEIDEIESLITSLTMDNINSTELPSSSNQNTEEFHLCTNNYEATFVEDLTVNFADKIKIIRDTNEEWLYVESLEDGRTGYVPRNIVLDYKQFVGQLKDRHSYLINLSSGTSLISEPICV